MSATWFDSVTLVVEVAWDDSPAVAIGSRTYTAHTSRVVSFSTNRGSTSELSGVGPGTAVVVLNDPDRSFDSANTGGAYYGKIRPMRPVRIRATVGATSATLFAGFLAAVSLGYDHDGKVPTATLTCVDGSQVLEGADCPGSAYGAAVLADSPTYYWPLQEVDAAGISWAAAGGLDMLRPTVGSLPHADESASLPVGETVSVTGGSFEAATTSGASFDFWTTYNGASVDSPVGSSVIIATGGTRWIGIDLHSGQVSYADSTAGKFTSYATIPYWSLLADQPHHIAVTSTTTTVKVYTDGVLAFTATNSSGSPAILYDETLLSLPDGDYNVSHLAIYSGELSADQVLAHYEAGVVAHGHPMGERTGTRIDRILDAVNWPSADRDIATGSTVCGQWEPAGADALGQIREYEATEQGLFFIAADGKATFRDRPWIRGATAAVTSQATFGDQASEIRYTEDIEPRVDVDHIRNVVTVTYPGSSVTVKDATSVTAYGQQRDTVNATALPATDGWLARQLGNYRLRQRKDAKQRIERIKVKARHPHNIANGALAELIQLDIGHRVTVNRRPPGGTGSISLELMVLGIRHDVTKQDANGWTTELYLSPAQDSYVTASYMVTGTSLTGSTVTSY